MKSVTADDISHFYSKFSNPFVALESSPSLVYKAMCIDGVRPPIDHSMFPDIIVQMLVAAWRYVKLI